MRVLVCGGRDYNDRECVFRWLDKLATAHGWLTLIQGGASGADRLARVWADKHHHGLVTFEAQWDTYGSGAGPIRNAKMLAEGKPNLVVAFPGGRGTADMVRRARTAGIEVQEVLK